jgi:hypothetical protein
VYELLTVYELLGHYARGYHIYMFMYIIYDR